MDGKISAYLPGPAPDDAQPLARFLPPVPPGAAARWLAAHVAPGSWVLDPFGASPALVLEMARRGYRVLVAANNPIIRFLIEMQAAPPAEDALRAALAALAATRTGDERLEPHLLARYHTTCGQCGQSVSADEFLWERDSPAGPVARRYHCPQCGQGGEFPALPSDADQAARAAATPLHRARALERVAALDDPDRQHAEEALQYYTPRTIYALSALINKLDALPTDQRNLLAPLLLLTFDRTNTLWPYPEERPRPRQLTVPPRYRERNVFREVEASIAAWARSPEARVPLSAFPDFPPETGGICIFDGPIRALAAHLPELEIAAVLTALPRPNQAFWTLSTLWAGWLWGREAAEPFKAALRRQRYDWRWHTAALHAALEHLAPQIGASVPILALLPETEPGLLTAALTAGSYAGLSLGGLALRAHDGQAQIHWRTSGTASPPALAIQSMTDAARAFLLARGEPSPFLPLQAAVLEKLLAEPSTGMPPSDAYTAITDALPQALTYRAGFLRYHAGKELDSGLWWLTDATGAAPPLAGRIETAVGDHLHQRPRQSMQEIDAAICRAFPGPDTPDAVWVAGCVASYGVRDPGGGWHLRPEDDPVPRKNEQNHVRSLLIQIGERLGFAVEAGVAVSWLAPEGGHHFYVTTSAQLGEIVFRQTPSPGQSWIVLPGSRANLALLARQRDPRLEHALRGWGLIKFRLVRHLAANPLLTRANLDAELRLDEPTYESAQMRML